MKVKCPNCGSEDIVFYQDKVFTLYYKLKKNKEPHKRSFGKMFQGDEAYGYLCNDCHSDSGIDGMSDWEVK